MAERISPSLIQGCTDPEQQITLASKFCVMVANICGYSAWNFFHDNLLVSRIFRGGF